MGAGRKPLIHGRFGAAVSATIDKTTAIAARNIAFMELYFDFALFSRVQSR